MPHNLADRLELSEEWKHERAERVQARSPKADRPAADEAPCCMAKADDLGRLPIGFCGPGCSRRAP